MLRFDEWGGEYVEDDIDMDDDSIDMGDDEDASGLADVYVDRYDLWASTY